jgi:hypothetical protein
MCSYGVRVEGDRNAEATPDKRRPRPRPWARAIIQSATKVNLASLVNFSRAIMLGEHGVGWSRRAFRMGAKARECWWITNHAKPALGLGVLRAECMEWTERNDGDLTLSRNKPLRNRRYKACAENPKDAGIRSRRRP